MYVRERSGFVESFRGTVGPPSQLGTDRAAPPAATQQQRRRRSAGRPRTCSASTTSDRSEKAAILVLELLPLSCFTTPATSGGSASLSPDAPTPNFPSLAAAAVDLARSAATAKTSRRTDSSRSPNRAMSCGIAALYRCGMRSGRVEMIAERTLHAARRIWAGGRRRVEARARRRRCGGGLRARQNIVILGEARLPRHVLVVGVVVAIIVILREPGGEAQRRHAVSGRFRRARAGAGARRRRRRGIQPSRGRAHVVVALHVVGVLVHRVREVGVVLHELEGRLEDVVEERRGVGRAAEGARLEGLEGELEELRVAGAGSLLAEGGDDGDAVLEELAEAGAGGAGEGAGGLGVGADEVRGGGGGEALDDGGGEGVEGVVGEAAAEGGDALRRPLAGRGLPGVELREERLLQLLVVGRGHEGGEASEEVVEDVEPVGDGLGGHALREAMETGGRRSLRGGG